MFKLKDRFRFIDKEKEYGVLIIFNIKGRYGNTWEW